MIFDLLGGDTTFVSGGEVVNIECKCPPHTKRIWKACVFGGISASSTAISLYQAGFWNNAGVAVLGPELEREVPRPLLIAGIGGVVGCLVGILAESLA